MKRFLAAAAAAVALAACGQSGALPSVPANDPNAPSRQEFQIQTSQASLSAEERAQLEQLVGSYLNDVQRNLAQGMNPAPGFSDHIVSLQPGRDDRWQIDLNGGTAYRIIGACDNECSNMDIELIGADGRVVASDVLPDDAPVVNVTPAASGRYTVRTLMQTCTVAPCYAGVRVLVN